MGGKARNRVSGRKLGSFPMEWSCQGDP